MIKQVEKEEQKDKAKIALVRAKEQLQLMFKKHKMCEVYDKERKCIRIMKVSKAKESGITKFKRLN